MMMLNKVSQTYSTQDFPRHNDKLSLRETQTVRAVATTRHSNGRALSLDRTANNALHAKRTVFSDVEHVEEEEK